MALLKQTWAIMIVLSWSSAAIAGSCLPPAPPWMPTNADDVWAYADLLIVDGNPQEDISMVSDPGNHRRVIKNGIPVS